MFLFYSFPFHLLASLRAKHCFLEVPGSLLRISGINRPVPFQVISRASEEKKIRCGGVFRRDVISHFAKFRASKWGDVV